MVNIIIIIIAIIIIIYLFILIWQIYKLFPIQIYNIK